MSVNWRSRIIGHGEEAPDQLLANPANWRIHPKAQQDALAGVLGEIGWVQSVIVNKRTGHLVDGHLRVSLALRDDAETIPVVYVDLSPDEEALVLATIDPLAAMATVDKAQLQSLLAEVSTSSQDVQRLLDEMSIGSLAATEQDATAPEVPVSPRAKLGDIFVIGQHRIACGDAFDEDLISKISSKFTIAGIVTDPPYGIDLDTDYSVGGGRHYRKIKNDDRAFDPDPIRSRFAKIKEQFWFGANYYRAALSKNDLDGSWLVWDKRSITTDEVVGSSFELIWSAQKHKQDILRYLWTNYTSSSNDGHRREHPTEKPIPMLSEIITRWIKSDGAIFDPFAGSGTTLIAAAKTGHIGLGIEIDAGYVDVIVQRLERVTGETARLLD